MTARHEIRSILCGILDNLSSNNVLNDPLINQLRKIKTNLEKITLSGPDKMNEVEDLVDEHSVIGFSENIIEKRLLEMAENEFKNNNDDEIDGIYK